LAIPRALRSDIVQAARASLTRRSGWL